MIFSGSPFTPPLLPPLNLLPHNIAIALTRHQPHLPTPLNLLHNFIAILLRDHLRLDQHCHSLHEPSETREGLNVAFDAPLEEETNFGAVELGEAFRREDVSFFCYVFVGLKERKRSVLEEEENEEEIWLNSLFISPPHPQPPTSRHIPSTT